MAGLEFLSGIPGTVGASPVQNVGAYGAEISDVLTRVRADERLQDVKVILLTARAEETDRIVGLEVGAWDYLAKPFEPEELLLRVAAILRRTGRSSGPKVLSLGDYEFDVRRSELLRGGEPVRLTEGEAQLLGALAAKADQPVDRLELARDSSDRDASLRAVDVQMTRLRRKIERDPRNPRYLQTVRGVGYMLAPD